MQIVALHLELVDLVFGGGQLDGLGEIRQAQQEGDEDGSPVASIVVSIRTGKFQISADNGKHSGTRPVIKGMHWK